ncbi:MAG: preprotein translocase subunit SecA [Proteobacteria bacterium]|nr:preprotein translocase subunit SecA [Pseudomonadota bacterium]
MIGGGIFKRIFGTSHERMMRKLHPIVVKINELEDKISALTDEQLKAQTPMFKEMLDNGATLDDILPEAFATVRETGRRVLNMRHYDVQMIGGIVLHRGMISEMKTGEGKTLVATSPMYLNALAGKGAHLVTVNDYLASRDADWMGQIYKFLGLSVGKILADLDNETRRQAYNCDITYGTNNEFGFDYLRDNMKYQLSDYVQRGHFYAIVDEVDSILIDEARTPLIISGQLEQDLNLYKEINKLVPFLKRDEDYAVDEKAQSVALNESGIEKLEQHLHIDNIYDPKYIEYLHHVNKALQAHTLYKLDQNYVIENGKVVIIDDFTGRMMYGRRWSDGLHQAIEAKEGVEIQAESQTLATITFQNYFRMYEKLAGMTGTADTEAEEFKKIYKLDVVSIPTANPVIRKDYQDVVYFNEKAKIAAIAEQIRECHEKGQPILVGTVSVEKSEVFSKAIAKLGIPHNVLNAKNHKREAEIIAQAGRKGAVTIATNMAGRGTDILLGGNPEFLARQEVAETDPSYPEVLAKYKAQCAEEKKEVRDAGGLFILGTERHESRRIDNQLRGRAGRQGDPGASRFFLSLDDDLLRIFGGEELKNRMAMFGMDKQADIPIESRIVTRSIETAQKRVEGRNFDIRKNLLEYDDVMNAQRKSIYGLRSTILKGEDLENEVLNAFEDIIYSYADEYMPAALDFEDWNFDGLQKTLSGILGISLSLNVAAVGRGDRDAQIKLIWDKVEEHYKKQVESFEQVRKEILKHVGKNDYYEHTTGKDMLMELAQNYYLREIDHFWRAHLTTMTSLRESISFRGYAQKDPKQEYKREAYSLFEKMMINIKTRMMTQLCKVQPQLPDFGRMQSNARANANAIQSIQAARNAEMSRADEPAEQSREEQVEALKQMAAQKRQPQPSLSMAEMLAVAQSQKPKAPDVTKKPLSMADLMPVSIANAAGKKPEVKETAKKPLSMADLMPVSIAKVAEEQRAEAEKMEEAPKRPLTMADLMPSSMKAAAEEHRRYMEKIRDLDEEADEADTSEEIAEDASDEIEEIVIDDSEIIRAEENSVISEKSEETDIPNTAGVSERSEKEEKTDAQDENSNDKSELSLSDLSALDSLLNSEMNNLSKNSDLTTSDSLDGWDDDKADEGKADDADPFGLFKSLGI